MQRGLSAMILQFRSHFLYWLSSRTFAAALLALPLAAGPAAAQAPGPPTNVAITTGPTLTQLTPASGPVGTSVVIQGNGFNTTQGTSTVTFGGVSATVNAWSTSSITVTVPNGATTGNVVVIVGGLASNGRTFTVSGGTSTSCTGPCYYIRQGGTASISGTGACNTNWNNACNDLPTTLVRGAIYYVAAGNYAARQLTTAQSGTTRITIKAATDADHGTGTGWVSTYDDTPAVFASGGTGSASFYISSGYWTISGTSRASLESGYHLKVNTSSTTVENIGFYVESGGLQGLIVEYVESPGMNTDNCTGSNGTGFFRDVGASPAVGSNGTILRYNYMHGHVGEVTINRTSNFTLGPGNVVAEQYSNVANCHAEIIAASGDSNVTIQGNYFRDLEGTGGIICLYRGSNQGPCANFSIYNNLWWRTWREGMGDGVVACINGMVCTGWKVYGNTFVAVGVTGSVSHTSFIEFNQAGSGSDVVGRNNLWEGSQGAGHVCTGGVTCTYANNTYSNTTGQNTGETGIQNVTGATFLTNSTGSTFDDVNFALVRDTSAWSALSSPYNVDIRGTTRTSSRGAFQR
jgi:hypothetical protein